MLSRFFFFLFVLPTLYAIPAGNPSYPKLLQKGIFSECFNSFTVSTGVQGDFVTDKRMKQYKEGAGRVDDFEINAAFFPLSFILYEFFTLQLKLGTAQMKANWRVSSPNLLNWVKAKSNHGFLITPGFYLLLYEWNKTSLGIGGNYVKGNFRINSLRIDGIQVFRKGGEWDIRFWQFHLGISHGIGFFIPYLGIKYSKSKSFIKAPSVAEIAPGGSDKNHFKNRDRLGLYLGTTITKQKYFFLQIEGRLFDEEAVSLSGEFRF